MKKVFFIVAVLSSFLCDAQTHYTAKDYFTEKNIVWYGIDYSHAKFIGSFAQFKEAGTIDGHALVDRYFEGWNTVIPHEQKKYDIPRFTHRETVFYDLEPVKAVNAKTNPDGIMQENSYALDKSQIPGIIKKYSGGEKKEGLGMVFITEAYNHSGEVASYYVVVFDIASKQVLISEYYTAKPHGIGIRNYWISTAMKTFEAIDEDYGNWKKSYGR